MDSPTTSGSLFVYVSTLIYVLTAVPGPTSPSLRPCAVYPADRLSEDHGKPFGTFLFPPSRIIQAKRVMFLFRHDSGRSRKRSLLTESGTSSFDFSGKQFLQIGKQFWKIKIDCSCLHSLPYRLLSGKRVVTGEGVSEAVEIRIFDSQMFDLGFKNVLQPPGVQAEFGSGQNISVVK